jgi:hypothetical protein
LDEFTFVVVLEEDGVNTLAHQVLELKLQQMIFGEEEFLPLTERHPLLRLIQQLAILGKDVHSIDGRLHNLSLGVVIVRLP